MLERRQRPEQPSKLTFVVNAILWQFEPFLPLDLLPMKHQLWLDAKIRVQGESAGSLLWLQHSMSR